MDDYDIFTSIKVWTKHQDKVLSMLCKNLVIRNLYKVEIQKEAFDEKKIHLLREKIKYSYSLTEDEINYFVFTGSVNNNAYDVATDKINILYRDGKMVDIADASDQSNIFALSQPVKKSFLCYPKTKF